MYIIINSIRTLATPNKNDNVYYNAEAHIHICDQNGNKEKEAYVLAHWDAEIYRFFYCCTYESMFDLAVSAPEDRIEFDFIESFGYIDDAIDSEYLDVYRMLNQIISNMCSGPKKPITYQAKMLYAQTQAKVIQLPDEKMNEGYYFSVTQSVEYANEIYEIKYAVWDFNEEIFLKKDNVIIEQYNDLVDASGSDWFLIFSKVKKSLIAFVEKQRRENPEYDDCDNVLIELYKDFPDSMSYIWTQKNNK